MDNTVLIVRIPPFNVQAAFILRHAGINHAPLRHHAHAHAVVIRYVRPKRQYLPA